MYSSAWAIMTVVLYGTGSTLQTVGVGCGPEVIGIAFTLITVRVGLGWSPDSRAADVCGAGAEGGAPSTVRWAVHTSQLAGHDRGYPSVFSGRGAYTHGCTCESTSRSGVGREQPISFRSVTATKRGADQVNQASEDGETAARGMDLEKGEKGRDVLSSSDSAL